MLIRIIVLLGLTQLLAVTHKPLVCSGIYTAVGLLMDLMFAAGGHAAIGSVVLWAVMRFAFASVYFGLLSRFDRGPLYWAILIAGFVIGLV